MHHLRSVGKQQNGSQQLSKQKPPGTSIHTSEQKVSAIFAARSLKHVTSHRKKVDDQHKKESPQMEIIKKRLIFITRQQDFFRLARLTTDFPDFFFLSQQCCFGPFLGQPQPGGNGGKSEIFQISRLLVQN